MKANISGYEAVEDGLNAGGIDRFVCNVSGEPLRNAEKAICKGSLFASMHQNTACMISEEDIEDIRYAIVRKEDQNAAFEIIILGRELGHHVLRTLRELSVPAFAAEDVSDVRHMTEDALVYSALRRMPVAVFVPVRLLRSRQAVRIDGTFCCDDLWVLSDRERYARIAALERKYNRMLSLHRNEHTCRYDAPKENDTKGMRHIQDRHDTCGGNGVCLVIGISGCAQQICEIAGRTKGMSICKLDMFGDGLGISDKVRKGLIDESFSKVVIMGHSAEYIGRVLRETGALRHAEMTVELGADKLHEIYEIKAALSECMQSGKNMPAVGGSLHYEAPKVMTSSASPLTDQMCPDCPYRTAIKDILIHCHAVSVYEDIYCERHGTVVRSGLATASSAYTGQLVLTNRKDCYYSGLDVRIIEVECVR